MKKIELLKMLEQIKTKFDGQKRDCDGSTLRVIISNRHNGYFLRIEGLRAKEDGELYTSVHHYAGIAGVTIYTILNYEQNKKRIYEYLSIQNIC